MVNDKAPQGSNAAHTRLMRLTLLLYRTPNLFAHGRLFSTAEGTCIFRSMSAICSDAMPDGCRNAHQRAKMTAFNATRERTAESLCRPITRRSGVGEPTCIAHAGSAMGSGPTAAS